MKLQEKLIWTAAVSLYIVGGYFLIGALPHYTAFHMMTQWDAAIPFLPIFIIFYAAAYFFTLLPFLFVEDKQFKRMVYGFLIMTTVAFAIFLIVPIQLQKPTVTNYMQTVYHIDTSFNNFPSLHVACALYAWLILYNVQKRVGYWTFPLLLGILASVLLVKQHLIIDVVGGSVLGSATFVWFKAPRSAQRKAAR